MTDSEKREVDATHQEDSVDQQLAHQIDHEDRETSKWQAIKNNPRNFAWCLYAVWTVLLVSFENQASGIVIGIPQFRKDFGFFFEGNYVLTAQWQAAFSGAPVASQVIGALASGQIADWIGRRNSLAIAIAISIAAISVEFIATESAVFFGGKFLNGFAVGVIQAVSTTYVGEIVPLALRGIVTCLIALSYTVGPFIVALIIYSEGTKESRWAYRSIFCSQYGFAAIAAAFIFFMPESPWWLADKGRDDKALDSLHRLGYTAESGKDIQRLANIKTTLEEIRAETEGVTYLECFRRSNLRRTLISIAPLVIVQFTGIVFAASYSTYYAQLAGYSTSMSFKLQITQQVMSMTGNVMSWYLIDKVGRRDLTIYGTLGLSVILWVMGGLAVGGSRNELRGSVAMVLLYCWLFNVTIGATSYTCLTETATSRLRVKTIAIGLAVANSISVMWSFVLPYMFNPDKGNLGGKVGFVFGALCFPCIALMWWFQPETRHRSYEELDEMFMKKVPARHFKSYRTEANIREEHVGSKTVDEV